MHIAFSEKRVLLEHVTEDILPQREINSCYILLELSGVVCLFILGTLLKYCKNILFSTTENQRLSDTISMRTVPVGHPSETEYDDFNKIFQTRCATILEPLTVLRKLNILYENSFPRASVFASGNRRALGELEYCIFP